MKKYFFAGLYFQNGGPWNVNRDIVKFLEGRASYVHSKYKIFRMFEILVKIIFADVVIFSGVSSVDHITVLFAKKIGRKIIYIMHGCLNIEYELNRTHSNSRGLKNEQICLNSADRILCVSAPYRDFIAERFPELQSKLGVLTNGINWTEILRYSSKPNSPKRKPFTITLAGCGRVTKRNLQVCQAVESLIGDGYKIHVDVFGYYQDNDDSKYIKAFPFCEFHGQTNYDKWMKHLQTTSLFVQNSEFEPFSLSVIEALLCGSDVLLSRNVGARDVIPGLKTEDVIESVLDVEEIKRKIKYVFEHSNNERLFQSINQNETSNQASVKRLLMEAERV